MSKVRISEHQGARLVKDVGIKIGKAGKKFIRVGAVK